MQLEKEDEDERGSDTGLGVHTLRITGRFETKGYTIYGFENVWNLPQFDTYQVAVLGHWSLAHLNFSSVVLFLPLAALAHILGTI